MGQEKITSYNNNHGPFRCLALLQIIFHHLGHFNIFPYVKVALAFKAIYRYKTRLFVCRRYWETCIPVYIWTVLKLFRHVASGTVVHQRQWRHNVTEQGRLIFNCWLRIRISEFWYVYFVSNNIPHPRQSASSLAELRNWIALFNASFAKNCYTISTA